MRPVYVTIESKQQGETVKQTLEGMITYKGETLYVRYMEPEEQGMGKTSTTIKFHFDELRVIRRGEVEAEQVFRMGEQMPGAYRIGPMRLAMETKLLELDNRLVNGLGTLNWRYELHVDGQFVDFVQVNVGIAERMVGSE
jgi:uncharacterized beta-barrel protein YwiB (DUF1934 family)